MRIAINNLINNFVNILCACVKIDTMICDFFFNIRDFHTSRNVTNAYMKIISKKTIITEIIITFLMSFCYDFKRERYIKK